MKIELQEVTDPHKRVWVSSAMPIHEEWFDSDGVKKPEIMLAGRAAVKKILIDGVPMIVRHYYRGGVPARFSKDRFLFRGWQSTRAYREIHLLQEMSAMGLPVPQPIAARSLLHGMFYSGDIMMKEIEHAQTLANLLMKEALALPLWEAVGCTIKNFHQHGFEHVDLNANNILIDQNKKIYLIDFDRCKRRAYSKTWAMNGIDRLHRSLQKFKRVEAQFYFEENSFSSLLHGYDV